MEAGDRFAAIDDAVSTRDETVECARDIASYNESAATELRRLQTEADLSDQAVGEAFGKFLIDTQAQTINRHAGREGGRSRLLLAEESSRGIAERVLVVVENV